MKSKGFSLVEILMAIAILVLIGGIGLPITFDAYKNFIFGTDIKNFLSILRRAENFSSTNVGAGFHGLSIQPNNFVLFRGSSYATRDTSYDEAYNREADITITGPAEIVFSPLYGNPNIIATWIFSDSVNTQTISINVEGAITW